MHGGEVADQIAEEVQNPAGIFLAEAAERAVGAARIEWEDRFQMRRLLFGDVKLLGTEVQRLKQEPTANLEAYQLYLKGRFHQFKWSEEYGGTTDFCSRSR